VRFRYLSERLGKMKPTSLNSKDSSVVEMQMIISHLHFIFTTENSKVKRKRVEKWG
jgi:hypothetical protein